MPISYKKTSDTAYDADIATIRIAFLDVGQGDTIVISSLNTREAFVVDCTDANATLEYLEQERILYLRGIIITHLHADHYSEVADLLGNCSLVSGLNECDVLAFNEIPSQKNLQKLLEGDKLQINNQPINQKKLPNFPVDDDSHSGEITPKKRNALLDLLRWRDQNKLQYDDLKVRAGSPPFPGSLVNCIKFLHPYAADYSRLVMKGLNNTSISMRVATPRASALLLGDLEPAGWNYLCANHSDLRSDILKFPHHGGAWSYTETQALLNTVKPSTVIISVGTEGQKYMHPNKEVFDVLSSSPYSHIRVLCTQATNQCGKNIDVLNYKQPVIKCLDQQAASNGRERIGSRRGCPCAGTVIMELSQQVRTIQPLDTFHQNKIILPYFSNHRCTF